MMEVPVLLIGYNRPEFLIGRVEEIIQMQVPLLYISIDGGDTEIKSLMTNAVEQIRSINPISTRIVIKYHPSSLGLVDHITSTISRVLNDHEKVIIVEDDIKLTRDFYSNMINGFNTLDSQGIKGTIGAFSPLRPIKLLIRKNSWRRTRYFSCWGWGCSREIWSDYQKDLSSENFQFELSHSRTWNSLSRFQRQLWIHRFTKISRTPDHTWDIQFQYLSFKKAYVQLVPVFRFVDNEGFYDHRAVHTSGSRPRWMGQNMIKESKVPKNRISLFSSLIEHFVDSNTIAGDTRLIQGRNRKSKT
jgi:hypothetical protein